ncbi:hypothetical protein PIB30_070226 [Stylosanthes scabra]|uniref:Uncharacterized protein n=1 Tax=Stylosanthes scabra TaxID=79078 RepID=A0ABU6UPG1_9FABA|nr:hypothetical protein [Stylosanthes scabra]
MDIPTHDATIPELDPQPEPEPVMQPEPEPVMPVMQPEPEPQPEPVIEIKPEPQEVIDGFVAACEEAEENVAAIKACEEAEALFKANKQQEMEKDNEIDVNIRSIVEDVVAEARHIEAQKKEATPELNKDQPAPGLMMVASVATQAGEYNPTKAFDLLRFETQPLQREETVELYDLDDFPEEEENPVTPAVPLQTVVPDRPAAAEATQISSDLKERCVVWALSDKKEIKYDSIFMVDGEWHYEVVRKQFRSMRPSKEIDAASSMMERYKEDYIDLITRRPHSITSLKSDEHLKLVNKAKLITHRYVSFKNSKFC